MDFDVLVDGKGWKVISNLVGYYGINPSCVNVLVSQQMRFRSF
jgi:hypothetical protein